MKSCCCNVRYVHLYIKCTTRQCQQESLKSFSRSIVSAPRTCRFERGGVDVRRIRETLSVKLILSMSSSAVTKLVREKVAEVRSVRRSRRGFELRCIDEACPELYPLNAKRKGLSMCIRSCRNCRVVDVGFRELRPLPEMSSPTPGQGGLYMKANRVVRWSFSVMLRWQCCKLSATNLASSRI